MEVVARYLCCSALTFLLSAERYSVKCLTCSCWETNFSVNGLSSNREVRNR